MVARTLQQRLIHGIRRVQADHVRDRQAALVAREPLDDIPRADLAFSLDGEIEPATAALVEMLDHVGSPETDPELVAGHARLCDNEFRRTDTVAVANPDLIFQQPLGGEILPECMDSCARPSVVRVSGRRAPAARNRKSPVMRRFAPRACWGAPDRRRVIVPRPPYPPREERGRTAA